MKIISCHIENFGKIQDADIDFNDGVNTIIEKNGWGKSTLAAFIRVMFFGLDNESKRDDLINDRKHFKPWQNGVYGGSLIFELDGTEYVVSLTFGAKEKDDTFEVRNLKTNLVTDEFSQALGQDILQIDSDSFKKTIFISQNDCETKSTASIDAKIGSLSDATDDLSNYEYANDRLTKRLNELGTMRSGLQKKTKEEIATLEAKTVRKPYIEEELGRLYEKKAEYKKQTLEIKEKIAVYEKEQKEINSALDAKVSLSNYDRILEQYNLRQNAFVEAQKVFPGEVPNEEELLEMRNLLSEISARNTAAKLNEFTPEDEARRNNLSSKFAYHEPTDIEIDGVISKCNKKIEFQNVLANKQASFDAIKAMQLANPEKKVSKVPGTIFIIMGILFVAAAMAAYFMSGVLVVAISAYLFGVILTISGIVLFAKAKKELSKPKVDPTKDLAIEIEECKNSIEALDGEVRSYLKNYGESDFNPLESLFKLKQQVNEYHTLLLKKKSYEDSVMEKEKLQDRIKGYVASLGITLPGELSDVLNTIFAWLSKYNSCKAEADAALLEKQNFETENDVEKLNSIREKMASLRSLDEVENDIDELERVLENIATENNEIAKRLESVEEDFNIILDAEESLKEQKEILEETKEKAKYLELAQSFLTKAKENFTAEYLEPMNAAFKKYSDMIYSDKLSFHFDVNSNLTIDEAGAQREARFFSSGLRDMMGLCTRLALIDAMYKGEKPFIIMDDPFVNLDDDKTDGAKEFLKKIGEEYQIIYFTCHKNLVV